VSASDSNIDFGANDWLVEEMQERYLADPTSVDQAWIEFFTKNGVTGTSSVTTPKAGVPPIPKAMQAQAAAPTAPVATPAAVAPAQTQQPLVTAPVVTTAPTPADPVAKPVPVLVTPAASSLTPIRGVSARVVQSMEASLSVPTATSVRAIPAKLMIDNRIVINNHLKRTRGGKVSFTHLIGYAMIKAMRAMPEMNVFYGEIDGKPAIGQPEHINIGIAIDSFD
jgi:2-oxoglutarate dehydrogenase E1 component